MKIFPVFAFKVNRGTDITLNFSYFKTLLNKRGLIEDTYERYEEETFEIVQKRTPDELKKNKHYPFMILIF